MISTTLSAFNHMHLVGFLLFELATFSVVFVYFMYENECNNSSAVNTFIGLVELHAECLILIFAHAPSRWFLMSDLAQGVIIQRWSTVRGFAVWTFIVACIDRWVTLNHYKDKQVKHPLKISSIVDLPWSTSLARDNLSDDDDDDDDDDDGDDGSSDIDNDDDDDDDDSDDDEEEEEEEEDDDDDDDNNNNNNDDDDGDAYNIDDDDDYDDDDCDDDGETNKFYLVPIDTGG